MTPPLFLVASEQLGGGSIVLSGREGHHAADVRRLRVGERVQVTDGHGARLSCRVHDVGRGQVVLSVERRSREAAPSPRVEVAQALVKHEAADRALAGMTEVGVDAVMPWTAERCVVSWPADRVERGVRRWRAGVAEAAKQSGRSWVPQVLDPQDTESVARHVADVDLALLLDGAGHAPIGDVLVPPDATVLVVVGPEGGHTDAETQALTAAGARRVHLGPTVLRSATAGTVAAAVLLSRTPRWLERPQTAAAG